MGYGSGAGDKEVISTSKEAKETKKMTGKEIKEKVESLYKEWRLHSSIEAKYRCEVYKELLEFIGSDTEEPVSEDLHKAAEKHALQCHSKKASAATLAASMYDFRAGANWQRNHVWHDSHEVPGIDKNIILFSPNHNVSLALWDGKGLISCTLGGGHDVIKPNDKWAYIEDIL